MSCCKHCDCQNKKFKFPTGWKLFRRLCIAAFLCFVVYLCKVKDDMEYAANNETIAAKPATTQSDAPRKKSALLKMVEGNKNE